MSACKFCGALPNPLRPGQHPRSQTITHAYDRENNAGCPSMYGYGGSDAEEQRRHYARWWLSEYCPELRGLQNSIADIRENGT